MPKRTGDVLEEEPATKLANVEEEQVPEGSTTLVIQDGTEHFMEGGDGSMPLEEVGEEGQVMVQLQSHDGGIIEEQIIDEGSLHMAVESPDDEQVQQHVIYEGGMPVEGLEEQQITMDELNGQHHITIGQHHIQVSEAQTIEAPIMEEQMFVEEGGVLQQIRVERVDDQQQIMVEQVDDPGEGALQVIEQVDDEYQVIEQGEGALQVIEHGEGALQVIEHGEGALQVIEDADGQQFVQEDMQEAEDGQIIQTMTEDGQQVEGDYQNIIIQHMDISEPLLTLRALLESRLHCTLNDHEFYLQDTIPLDPTKNLVSQCVQGSGMVQINVEVKSQPGIRPRLNIVDILKPAEEVVELQTAPEPQEVPVQVPAPTKVVIPFPEESENVTRWIVDQAFRKEQERLKIPFDPALWNEAHVKHWIQWAIKEFTLNDVSIENFRINGRMLCNMKHDEFVKLIPRDKGDTFWTHLELLRKCKFVAVIQQPTPHAITTITVSSDAAGNLTQTRTPKTFQRTPRVRNITIPTDRASPGNRTGNNGQIQLWQFLLELLTDKDCREVIHWIGDEGEFKLNNPEMVAQLWGQRKNKPTMNYEKLSRALRYYYDGDMIAKVHGKRFVYKFVCDLQMLLGYTAGELNRLVTECAERKIQKVRDTLRGPTIIRRTLEIK